MHALQMRAASIGASALLLGAAVFAAVTLKYVTTTWTPPEPPGIPIVTVETPPPPVVPETVRQTAPPTEETEFAPPEVTPLPFVPTNIAEVGAAGGSVAPQLPTIANPHWRRRPADLARYYPRRAMDAGVEGLVELSCLVETDGRLTCAVLSETPPSWRFGEAALAIARDHRMEPAMREGVAVQGRYTMRVPFNLR